jgi:hypothetical protein
VKYERHAAVGSTTAEELAAFTHAALFSLALSTPELALDKRYLTNFPGLTKNPYESNHRN